MTNEDMRRRIALSLLGLVCSFGPALLQAALVVQVGLVS